MPLGSHSLKYLLSGPFCRKSLLIPIPEGGEPELNARVGVMGGHPEEAGGRFCVSGQGRMVWPEERRAGFQRLCLLHGQPCHGFRWGPSETSLGESSVCSALPGVLRHLMVGSGLLPLPQSTCLPGARAFLLSSSARDTLGHCPCEWRGCWLQSKGRGLWRGTMFTSALPGVTLGRDALALQRPTPLRQRGCLRQNLHHKSLASQTPSGGM